ncbi:MAG: hypothetical protein GF315_14290 [candidate division Zixibacteria bacterium]|nr:hypothetical protein [candidate division Zixibacteria bacterium]
MRKIFTFTFALLLFAAAAFAAIYPVSDKWMVNHSEVIVAGEVVSITSDYEADGLIWSYATIQVDQVVMGLASDQVTFKYQGGTVGDMTLRVSTSPTFEEGEEVLVFLKSAEDGTLEITNWVLSKRTLVDGRFIEVDKPYHEYIDELTEIANTR